MKQVRILGWLTGGLFVLYGLVFALFPQEAARAVTGSAPDTVSGLVDLRATYGGMSIGVGIVILLLSRRKDTAQLALLSIVAIMTGMASTRALGILLDGNPSWLMYGYQAAEVAVAIWAPLLMKRVRSNP